MQDLMGLMQGDESGQDSPDEVSGPLIVLGGTGRQLGQPRREKGLGGASRSQGGLAGSSHGICPRRL